MDVDELLIVELIIENVVIFVMVPDSSKNLKYNTTYYNQKHNGAPARAFVGNVMELEIN